jgi:SAM-dependent methyltransferase
MALDSQPEHAMTCLDSPSPASPLSSQSPEEVRAYYRQILPFFERELADRGDGDFWAWAASEPLDCRVLELGAGTGRATAFLAGSAGRVVAFDLSAELIAVARRKLVDASNVHLFVADLRAIALQMEVDLVAAVDDPFVHLTGDADREQAFSAAVRPLAPGGRFLLDAAWFRPEQREEAGLPEGLRLEHSNRGLQVQEFWHCDPETRQCSARFQYRVRSRVVEGASFAARLWSLDEVEKRAAANGLRVTQVWGDFDRRPWDRSTSPRLLVEMRRD